MRQGERAAHAKVELQAAIAEVRASTVVSLGRGLHVKDSRVVVQVIRAVLNSCAMETAGAPGQSRQHAIGVSP